MLDRSGVEIVSARKRWGLDTLPSSLPHVVCPASPRFTGAFLLRVCPCPERCPERCPLFAVANWASVCPIVAQNQEIFDFCWLLAAVARRSRRVPCRYAPPRSEAAPARGRLTPCWQCSQIPATEGLPSRLWKASETSILKGLVCTITPFRGAASIQ